MCRGAPQAGEQGAGCSHASTAVQPGRHACNAAPSSALQVPVAAGMCSGYGFVTFGERQAAEQAMEALNGQVRGRGGVWWRSRQQGFGAPARRMGASMHLEPTVSESARQEQLQRQGAILHCTHATAAATTQLVALAD